jgi:hypothetical protein
MSQPNFRILSEHPVTRNSEDLQIPGKIPQHRVRDGNLEEFHKEILEQKYP